LKIELKKLHPGAILPRIATTGSAGADLSVCLDAPLTIKPGERVILPLGFAAAVPPGYAGLICARSSLSAIHGIALANGVGVVDSDYRGEWRVALINHSDKAYEIHHGDRVAQVLLIPAEAAEFAEAAELDDTERGGGGYGSTGRN
jgi:dUTP pyrophosphatase